MHKGRGQVVKFCIWLNLVSENIYSLLVIKINYEQRMQNIMIKQISIIINIIIIEK